MSIANYHRKKLLEWLDALSTNGNIETAEDNIQTLTEAILELSEIIGGDSE